MWVKVSDLPKYGERKNSMILMKSIIRVIGIIRVFGCIQWREGATREN